MLKPIIGQKQDNMGVRLLIQTPGTLEIEATGQELMMPGHRFRAALAAFCVLAPLPATQLDACATAPGQGSGA